MSTAIAICSLLHEENAGSMALSFRDRPVLSWTLDRLRQASRLQGITLLCWDDQLAELQKISGDLSIQCRGARSPDVLMQGITAARRWADGWRGGLLQTCDFDAGFDAIGILNTLTENEADLAVLIDPSSALIDPDIVDALIERANEKDQESLIIAPAASGLSGVLLRRSLIEKLAAARTHPGKLVHYLPDQPMRDPIAGEGCIDLPKPVKRSSSSFRLDSARQIDRLTPALQSLNGQLRTADAEQIVTTSATSSMSDRLPREVTLELNTERQSRAIFRFNATTRATISMEDVRRVIDELAESPDVRLTLAGVGDPLEAAMLFDVIELAKSRGIRAINVETDLLADNDAAIDHLAAAAPDIVSVHVPARTAPMYERIMGIDALPRVLGNIATLLKARLARGAGVPIVVPTFTKCRENLGEMEGWYDQWIRAIGCAAIVGANNFAGQIVDVSVGNMMPPRRRPCRRLDSRLTILCDGTVVACEQDLAGRKSIGRIGEQSISDIWNQSMTSLRHAHAAGEWATAHPLCGSCAEWNRP